MRSLLQRALEREIRQDRLAEELSRRLGNGQGERQHVDDLAKMLEPFLGSMFHAFEVSAKFAKDSQCGRAVTFTIGQVLQYCFDEDDLFPERDYGILGLLDDAYLVHRFAGMLQQMYPHVELSDAKYRPPDEKTLRIVRAMLPAGVCDALDRTCYNLIQVSNSLFAVGAKESYGPIESLATLRVSEAISILTTKMDK